MIGIIGFGRFGKLMAGYMARDCPIKVFNRSDKSEEISRIGGVPADLTEVCRQKTVILSVPISRMKEMLQQIAPLLNPNATVVDVCSVKVYPVKWMLKMLPSSVSILGTHPMFGPDSAGESLHDRKIVLCKARLNENQYQKIRGYLTGKGLNVIEATPQEHDRQIAVSLALTHFIGRGLDEYGARELTIDTEGYKRLLNILGVVTHDTWQLFEDMHYYNPYAKEHREAFMSAMRRLEKKIEQSK